MAQTEAAHAIELFHQDGKPAGVWYCSKCRAVAKTEADAQQCHGERLCECGKPVRSRYSNSCQWCDNIAWAARIQREELKRYEKATKIPQSEWKGDQVFICDRYFESVEEAVEHMESGDMPTPEYIWAAHNQGIPLACIDNLLENILDNLWEDADSDDLNGVPELETAIAAFNEANKSVICWMVDYSTAILIEEAPNAPA